MFDSATQILASIRKGDLSSIEVLMDHSLIIIPPV